MLPLSVCPDNHPALRPADEALRFIRRPSTHPRSLHFSQPARLAIRQLSPSSARLAVMQPDERRRAYRGARTCAPRTRSVLPRQNFCRTRFCEFTEERSDPRTRSVLPGKNACAQAEPRAISIPTTCAVRYFNTACRAPISRLPPTFFVFSCIFSRIRCKKCKQNGSK